MSTWPCFVPGLFNNFQDGAFFYLGRSGTEDGPHRSRRSALLADHFPYILFGHFKLQNGGLISLNLGDINLFRMIHQCLSDIADQVFHGAISFAGGLETEATKQRGGKYFEHVKVRLATDQYSIINSGLLGLCVCRKKTFFF